MIQCQISKANDQGYPPTLWYSEKNHPVEAGYEAGQHELLYSLKFHFEITCDGNVDKWVKYWQYAVLWRTDILASSVRQELVPERNDMSKLSLSRPWKYMEGGIEIQLHSFITSSLVGGEWSASFPGRFTPSEKTSMGPRAGLDFRGGGKLSQNVWVNILLRTSG